VGFALQSVPLKGSTLLSSSSVSSKMRRFVLHLYQPACQQMECQISPTRRLDSPDYVGNKPDASTIQQNRTLYARRRPQLNDVERCRSGYVITRQSKPCKPEGKLDLPVPCHVYPKIYAAWQSRATHARRHAQPSNTKQSKPKGWPCSEMSNVVYPKIHAEGHCQTEITRRQS
jgi:hypothetical protein